ncbi:hypothetical protein DL96DRAFT_1666819 [Flagelloscypha sp. PMI_526]|nr:hypothetical protein DL96DRAFT_1666819 [Flagelloscypha sp. PMI_526]
MLSVFASARKPVILKNYLRYSFSTVGTTRHRPKLVLLGGGWGGYEILRKVDKKLWDVTIVSPSSHFNFTPLLAGRYTPDATAYQAWCDNIGDHPSKFKLEYDKLVIAVGAYSQTFGVPGVKEHGFFLKDIADARKIRSRILECFEQANSPLLSDVERRNLLHFCIVGGGPTGTEFAAELHDLLHEEIKKHYPSLARMARISLFDVAPSILGSFDKNLVQYAEKTFAREGIHVLTSHHVEKVEHGKLFVRESGEVPFGLLVWNTGLAPNPLIQSISQLKKDERGGRSIAVDKHLNALRHDGTPNEDVFVIGDASIDTTQILPATAQVANQQAKYLTKKLNKLVKGKPSPNEFEFHSQGSLAYIGNWKAIYDGPSSNNTRVSQETGRLAWLLWRSAYFTMTLSARNKILVPVYWDLTRF